jgi:transcriptional regulatory protein LevR
MLQMAGGELHAVVLSCITGVGTDRAIESFVHYCINNPDVSERSDKNVDMSKLNTTVDKITQHMQRAIAIQTSLEKSDYKDRWFDRSKLTEEIVRLMWRSNAREKKMKRSVWRLLFLNLRIQKRQ